MLSGRDILDNVIVWPRRKREEKTKKQKRILTQRTTSLTLSTPTVVPADTYLLTHGVENVQDESIRNSSGLLGRLVGNSAHRRLLNHGWRLGKVD